MQRILALIVRFIDATPFRGYRTYLVNVIIALLALLVILEGSHLEVGVLALGFAVSQLYMRNATANQSTELMHLQHLVEALTKHQADAGVGVPPASDRPNRTEDSV